MVLEAIAGPFFFSIILQTMDCEHKKSMKRPRDSESYIFDIKSPL